MSAPSTMSLPGTCDHRKVLAVVAGMKDVRRMEQAIQELEAKAHTMYQELDGAKNKWMAEVRDLNQEERFLLQSLNGLKENST